MSSNSSIEWTESTWNPTRGCSRVSPGCVHCYAERFAHRLSGPGLPYEALTKSTSKGPRWTGKLMLAHDVLALPLSWKKARLIFVNSMSDLFHERVPLDYIKQVFDVMERAHWHRFQVLTKRSERLCELARKLPWPKNVWIGVSVESDEYLDRVDHLREVPGAVRFLSLEPLIGPLDQLRLDGIGWVIVGGESGPGARRMEPSWARDIRDKCLDLGVPFFFKQWGGVRKGPAGRELDGRTWDEIPDRPVPQAQMSLVAR